MPFRFDRDKFGGGPSYTNLVVLVLIYSYIRSSHRRCSVKKGVLRNFAKFTGKHLCLRPATLLKKSLAHVFSCEFCEFFKKNYFYRTPLMAASDINSGRYNLDDSATSDSFLKML